MVLSLDYITKFANMNDKLTQKHLLKGTVEFEIDDEDIHIRTKPPFGKEEILTVRLSVLNPEPVINKSSLEFVSRINNEALVSLASGKPNAAEFNAFIGTLKTKVATEYNAFIGMSAVNEEPPEFREQSTEEIAKTKKVKVESLESSIQMLETYVDTDEIKPLLDALRELKKAPENQAKLAQVATAFNGLPNQGPVLTYAPYVNIMLSDDPFGL